MNENNNSTQHTQKRTRRKFNVVDFLLIVVVLLICASLVYLFLPSSLVKNITADQTVPLSYVIEVKGVDEQYIDNISVLDLVQDSVSKGELGTVEAVENNPYSELKYNMQQEEDNGVGILSSIKGKYNLTITVTATARYEEGEGYTVNGTRIAVGEKIYAKFPNYACEAYCISLEQQ